MIARLFTQFLLAVALLTSSTVASARFIQVDPAPVEPNNIHSFNRYAYGNNNPYKYVDPDGRHPLLIFAAVGAATPAIANFGMRMAPYAQRGVAEAMSKGVTFLLKKNKLLPSVKARFSFLASKV